MSRDGHQGRPRELRASPRPQLDERRLRAAGLATSVVAALIAVVGILLARGVFRVPMLGPEESGAWGSGETVAYALAAFGCGLLATVLMFLLLRTTPSPITYFGWIVGLVTAVTVVMPLTTDSDVGARVATALINAVIGTAVGSLTVSAARRSVFYVPPTEPELQPPFS